MPITYSNTPPAPEGMSAADAEILREQLQEDTLQTLAKYILDNGGANGTEPLVLTPSNTAAAAGETAIQARTGTKRVRVSEDGGIWKHITKESIFYDIRDYGALPGLSGKTATTAAFTTIFTEINAVYNTATGVNTYIGKNAAIYIPYAQGAWYVGDGFLYSGSYSNQLVLFGDGNAWASDSDRGGSMLIFDGTAGQTAFDFRGASQMYVRNVTFNGGRKAKHVVHVRQYWEDALRLGSTGFYFDYVGFIEPGSYTDSACFAAGRDDDPPNTPQCDTMKFRGCIFQGLDSGSASLQGWGFRSITTGNTKRFDFEHCNWNYVHRAVEGYSGDCTIISGALAVIGGYFRGGGAAFIWHGNSLNVIGSGMENGPEDRYAKFIVTGQNTKLFLNGAYFAGSTPADDVVVEMAGSGTIINNSFEANSRSSALMPGWRAGVVVAVGDDCTNDSGKAYRCITGGTTAGAGGPTGTGASIADNTAVWKYMGSANANHLKFLAGNNTTANGWGGIWIVNNVIGYITTSAKSVWLIDGSGNHLGGSQTNGDYARGTAHKTFIWGNVEGLYGSNMNEPLLDFVGDRLPSGQDQMWTNNLWTYAPNAVINRNAEGVYSVTIPATDLKNNSGTVPIAYLPPFATVSKCIARVTTPFAGPAGNITLSVGVQWGNVDIDDDGILLGFDAKTAAITKGKDVADYGAKWAAGLGYVGNDPGGYQDKLYSYLTVGGGGTINDINAGSVTFYIEFRRLG